MPIRTCIACRKKASPDEFLRLVRIDGEISIWKGTGRSAYLCANSECVDIALRKASFERALKTSISADAKERLRAELERKLR